MLQKDVVVVTFNYRLGPFGFLSLSDPSLGVPGNAGLKDQNFALKWIQRNIVKFGGDPGNVTLAGQSAGGASVHYHMISELSNGLFRRAIPMSGVAFNCSFALQPRRNWHERLAIALNYNGPMTEREILDFLEDINDPMDIVKAADKVLTREVINLFDKIR